MQNTSGFSPETNLNVLKLLIEQRGTVGQRSRIEDLWIDRQYLLP
jgi:hypothetical protein